MLRTAKTFFLLATVGTATAAVLRMEHEVLIQNADAIIVGTVSASTYEPTHRSGPTAITHYTVLVEDALVGNVERDDLLDVRTAGGRLPDLNGEPIYERVAEAPKFLIGDHVVLFLYHLDDPRDLHLTKAERDNLPDAWGILGWRQGVRHIDDGTETIEEHDIPVSLFINQVRFLLTQE